MASESELMTSSTHKRGAAAFLEKLYEILEISDYSEYIGWQVMIIL
jgi:hypothetical protein